MDSPIKKVVFAIGSLTNGGAERVVSLWASDLAEQGYDVFIALCVREADEYRLSSKVKVRSIANSIQEFGNLSNIQRILKARKMLQQIKPHFLISFLPGSQELFFVASIGLRIHRIETVRISPWHIRLPFVRRILWRACFCFADRIIVQTAEQADFFTRWERRKAIVIPNPLSEKFLNNYKEEVSDRVTRFIACGRIDPQKNYPMMIDAFASIVTDYPDLQLEIFGKGSSAYESWIRQYIEQKGMSNHIHLMGRTTTIEEEFRKNEIFLMTSDYEGLPNALMEAMACRLVCVATSCKTGPKDLISSGENGWLCPVGDTLSMEIILRKVLQMGLQDRLEMGMKARQRVLDFCSKECSISVLSNVLELKE